MTEGNPDRGRPIRVDPNAVSADPNNPAFVSRPSGAPVYYGFPTLDDVEVDGFRLGMITDWEAVPTDVGDSFVVAPDNSRAGLIWEVRERAYVTQSLPPDGDRWGVWNVGFTRPMRSREAARANLAEALQHLRPVWEQWRNRAG